MISLEDFINKFKNEDISSYSQILSNLSPLEFISLGCIISIIISQSINPNEQNTIGNFLEMVGQILLTSYAQASTTIPKYTPATLCQLDELKKLLKVHLNNTTN